MIIERDVKMVEEWIAGIISGIVGIVVGYLLVRLVGCFFAAERRQMIDDERVKECDDAINALRDVRKVYKDLAELDRAARAAGLKG